MLCKLSVRKRWLLSFLAVIVVILSIISVINRISINIINDELLRVNTNAFNYLQQTIDTRMQEVTFTAAEFSINNKNISLMESNDPTQFTNGATSSFLDLLRSAKMTNDFISSVYIYYPSTEYVVGDLGCYPAYSYWQLLNVSGDTVPTDSFTVWIQDKIENNVIGFYVDSYGQLLYRTTFPRSGNTVKGILILEIDNSAVDSLLQTVADGRAAVIAVLDSDNHVFNYVGDETALQTLQEKLEKNLITEKAENNVTTIQANDSTLLAAVSSYSNIRYALLADNSQMLKASQFVTCFSVIGIAVCLVLGLTMGYYFSRRHSRSIEKLAASLVQEDGTSSEVGYEFDFLEQRVASLLQQNVESLHRNEELSWRLKASFLSKILDTSQEEPNVIAGIAVFNGISFDFMQYRLLLCAPEPDAAPSVPDWNIVRKNIQLGGMYMEMENNIIVIPTVQKDAMAILLNYNAEDFDETMIDAIAHEFSQLASYESEVRYQTVCSDEFESLSLLVSIYEQTARRLRFAPDGCLPERASQKENGRSLFSRWEKSVQDNKFIQASTLCGEVLTTYVKAAPSAYCKRSRQYVMANTILEHLREGATHNSTIVIAKAEEDLFAAFSDLQRMQTVMQNLLMDMETENKNYFDRQQGRVAQDIKRVIDENFTQPYLGLYFISDAVGVSTSYVSKIFKQKYGIGVNDYINHARISRAKELIEKGNMTIRDIAVSVGFSSDINFIRVFKKLEYTTPGQFRRDKE